MSHSAARASRLRALRMRRHLWLKVDVDGVRDTVDVVEVANDLACIMNCGIRESGVTQCINLALTHRRRVGGQLLSKLTKCTVSIIKIG